MSSKCTLILLRLSSHTHQTIRVQTQLGMSKPQSFQVIREKQQLGMSKKTNLDSEIVNGVGRLFSHEGRSRWVCVRIEEEKKSITSYQSINATYLKLFYTIIAVLRDRKCRSRRSHVDTN